jgi:hypothetical protein
LVSPRRHPSEIHSLETSPEEESAEQSRSLHQVSMVEAENIGSVQIFSDVEDSEHAKALNRSIGIPPRSDEIGQVSEFSDAEPSSTLDHALVVAGVGFSEVVQYQVETEASGDAGGLKDAMENSR